MSDDIDPIEAVIKNIYKRIEELEKKIIAVEINDSAWARSVGGGAGGERGPNRVGVPSAAGRVPSLRGCGE